MIVCCVCGKQFRDRKDILRYGCKICQKHWWRNYKWDGLEEVGEKSRKGSHKGSHSAEDAHSKTQRKK